MTTEQEFDLLRQTCSTALQQFITEARKTELGMQQLTVPVGVAAARQFISQRSAEAEAHENYTVASTRLLEFLQKHLYIVH